MNQDLNALIEAAMQAKKFLTVHHWNDNAPGRGCWNLDAAGKAYTALDKALDQAAVTKLQKINPVDELIDGGRY